jgi:cation transport ATPase
MAVTMLTPTEAPPADDPGSASGRWRRAALENVRRKLAPWLAIKGVLIVLVLAGLVRVWPAFVLDTAVSVVAVAYAWRLARRKPV